MGQLGPCASWITAEELCSDVSALSPEDKALVVRAASGVLYKLSGQRFSGPCEVTVRPGCAGLDESVVQWLEYPGGTTARPIASGCGCDDFWSCACRGPEQVSLRPGPVVSVEEVRVDGVVVGDYFVMDRQYLVRSGGASWPCCQRWDLPGGEPGTFEVDYVYGQSPPAAGVLAAGVLACELGKAKLGLPCDLPKRVSGMTRENVTYALIIDPMDFLDNGRTGLHEVDLFLSAYNPDRLRRSGKVFTPGVRGTGHRET